MAMQNPLKERIAKIRDEIAQSGEANRLAIAWRQEDQLVALIDWKKLCNS
jgi:hypothetical protein